MLRITLPAAELWDERKQEFVDVKEQTLQLEHSLVSLSKWESKWCKAYLKDTVKSNEEVLDYIRCMTITQNVKPETYNRLTRKNINDINNYINAPMTAVYFPKESKGKSGGDTITSELIYYWMITAGIPFECQKWHLNRLIALIRVCQMKNQPAKNVGKAQTAKNYAAMNAARRAKHRTRG